MAFIPATFRRSGHQFGEAASLSRPLPFAGVSGLPQEHQRSLGLGARHLRQLGDRALAEFVADLSRDDIGRAIALLERYRRLTPDMVQRAGGWTIPQSRLHEVPR